MGTKRTASLAHLKAVSSAPFLANVYLHELDEFVAGLQARREKGTRKRHNPIYHRLSHKKRRLVARGESKTR
jgi:hypothetical protein